MLSCTVLDIFTFYESTNSKFLIHWNTFFWFFFCLTLLICSLTTSNGFFRNCLMDQSIFFTQPLLQLLFSHITKVLQYKELKYIVFFYTCISCFVVWYDLIQPFQAAGLKTREKNVLEMGISSMSLAKV